MARVTLTLACMMGWHSCIWALALLMKNAATGRMAASTAAMAQNGITCGGRVPPFTCGQKMFGPYKPMHVAGDQCQVAAEKSVKATKFKAVTVYITLAIARYPCKRAIIAC